jgi:penicillin amidase
MWNKRWNMRSNMRSPLSKWSAACMLTVLAGCAVPQNGDKHASDQLKLDGLRQPVAIVRDNAGISHIYAKNTPDLFFAQGYSAARDRLWQLDLWRRQGEGKMAEQFGPRFVEQDRAARMFLYRGDLAAEYASYHPEARQILQSFADGINAYIRQVQADPAKLPIEFKLTGTQPGQWSAQSSLIRIYGITRNVKEEVKLAREIAAVGVTKTESLNVFEPPAKLKVPAGINVKLISNAILADYMLARDGQKFKAEDFPKSPLAMADRIKLAGSLSDARMDLADNGGDPYAPRYESNNWTVSGSRTASGKPLLSNDPHRTISMPSLRYMVHLNAPGWNVIGAGEPALPGVSLGHNDRVAFGLTIFAFGDEEDLYVYDTRPGSPDEYRYRGKWEQMKTVDETIGVRGAQSRVEPIKFTRHGPVIYEDAAAHKAYAVRAAYLEFPGTASYLASLRLDQAQDWASFAAGMAHHYTPGENMVYADVDGNIGWFGGALAPVRPRADWSGMLPVPGDGRYEWRGLIEGNALPSVRNPQAGFFATANAFYLPSGYRYAGVSARTWAEPFRKERIDEVLSKGHGLTREDMEHLQYDEHSLPARYMVSLTPALKTDDPRLGDAVQRLRQWDAVIAKESSAATIYEYWMPEVVQRVTDLSIPPDARKIFGKLEVRQVLARLQHPDKSFGRDPVAARDALLLDALGAGMEKLRARLGNNPDDWQWGKLHHIKFDHQLAAFMPEAERQKLATPSYPLGGDNDTVHRGTYRSSDFRQISGASYREVIDLSDWDRSRVQNTPGQSSDPASPFYRNLLQGWAEGVYSPMAFSRAAVQKVQHDTLVLEPGASQ